MHYSIDQWVALDMATEIISGWDLRSDSTPEENQLVEDLKALVISMSEDSDLEDQLETIKSTLEGS